MDRRKNYAVLNLIKNYRQLRNVEGRVCAFVSLSRAFPWVLFLLFVLSYSDMFIFVLSYVSFHFIIITLMSVYFRRRDRVGVGWIQVGRGSREGLAGVRAGETIFRVYCMKKNLFQINNKKSIFTKKQ